MAKIGSKTVGKEKTTFKDKYRVTNWSSYYTLLERQVLVPVGAESAIRYIRSINALAFNRTLCWLWPEQKKQVREETNTVIGKWKKSA